ncbi:hypothetical protein F3Y22_tig00005459pilonHSYRG00061 [Hibiscus syriacus]|uniref:CSC1/OSCA1-like cytosolic domain-containing protein n=1 Tax=Hibiscus syriacus TaxID=106335 RepID=A0A6A3CIZ7_HIBSY|nr:hypothetical protein F3Y22_tig00005459pilonHSYRG00061 [Hibiscus syriacus]
MLFLLSKPLDSPSSPMFPYTDIYLCHQPVYDAKKFAKLMRKRDRLQHWLDYNQMKLERHPEKRPTKKMAVERQKVVEDTKSILPVAFVSFKSRWGAAVCVQTQQIRNPTLWLTNWAPEPAMFIGEIWPYHSSR